MVQFFKPQPKSTVTRQHDLRIEALDVHGDGIGRLQGKVVFVEGALPGEQVRVRLQEDARQQHARASLISVLEPAAERQAPFCPHYAECGGCSTQHMSLATQHACKIAGVQQLFSKLSGQTLGAPDQVFTSPDQGYRRVCRLSIKYDKKARCARMGFRKRQSHDLVEVAACPVLAPALSALITPLRALCNAMKGFRDLGHIELIEADNGPLLLLRHNAKPGDADLARLTEFAREHGLQCYLQTDGAPARVWPLDAAAPYYDVAGQRIHFLPGDFLQVNRTINAQMVQTVLDWLAPTAQDKVLDLFCGLGNFTLPLGQVAGEVVGIEGVQEMVLRARSNAEALNAAQAERGNACAARGKVRFFHCNLEEPFHDMPWAREPFSLVLLDPARPGAAGVMPHLVRLAPARLVYVSCNPVTAARDSKALFSAGYRLVRWGLFDMFPHTGHVESILLFERDPQSTTIKKG